MKKVLLATIMAAVMLTAFTYKSAVTPTHRLRGFALAKPSGAVPFHQQMNIDLAANGYYIINGCTCEYIQITNGILHTDYHGVINGNRISVSYHDNAQHLVAVGPDGTEYRGNGVDNYSFNGSLVNGAYNTTSTTSVVLTTAGRKNNGVFRFDTHITINAKGEVTAVTDNFRFACQ